MNVPIFDGERIVAVAGVGNKETAYDESDVRQLTLLMQGMWRLIQQRAAEEELRRARDELEDRVRARTAELAAANEDLQQERYLLHTLMDNLPHSIYFKDRASRFLRINRRMAQMLRPERRVAGDRQDRSRFLHRGTRPAGAGRRAGDPPHRPPGARQGGEGNLARRPHDLGGDHEDAAVRRPRPDRRHVRHLAATSPSRSRPPRRCGRPRRPPRPPAAPRAPSWPT